jgi:hypothetical protein
METVCEISDSQAGCIKVAVFWDAAPCILVEIKRRFRTIVLMLEAVSTSETSVYSYKTVRRNIPEGCQLYIIHKK